MKNSTKFCPALCLKINLIVLGRRLIGGPVASLNGIMVYDTNKNYVGISG